MKIKSNLAAPLIAAASLVFFVKCQSPESGQNQQKHQAPVKITDDAALYFKKVQEPNERAFEVLVPKGWQTKGGIFRLNPSQIGGAGNAIAAKYDFAVYNNDSAEVQIRWLPDYLFIDMQNSPARPYFPDGSINNGMEVKQKTDPVDFIMQVAIPYAHPGIQNLRRTGQKDLDGLARAYNEFSTKTGLLNLSYSAAKVDIEYLENGNEYEETIVVVIEDWGQPGAGLWGNKGSMFIRAPKGKLKDWAPILETIHASVKINIPWLIEEIKGQQVRGSEFIKVQQQIQNIDKEIAAHRQKTNYEIQNDMYLTLTEQEEYINPYTGEIEIGTNRWYHRWQNDLGEIIYTNNEDYDPNSDPGLNVSGFRRSKIRKR